MTGLAADTGIEPDPPPFDGDQPERGEQWAPGGGRPSGLEFLGCRGTFECWLIPCPCCCRGWVPVVPDGTEFGYRTAVEIGCSRGCEPELVAWWHAWRLGEPVPRPKATDDQRRYARAAVRRALGDALVGKDVIARAREAGRFADAAGLAVDHLADAFAQAGKVPPHLAHAAILAGTATPARLPNAA